MPQPTTTIPNSWDGSVPLTNYNKWHLRDEKDGPGDHVWEYKPDADDSEQNFPSRYWLGLEVNAPTLSKAKTPYEAARNGYEFYKHIQQQDGHWAGEYGGPMFLLGGFVIGAYITGTWFKEEERLELIRYLFNRAEKDDGGWGLHIEGHTTVFGIGMNYVSLRLLGVDADHPKMIKARATLHKLGGCAAIPSWGKFWLSILNVYEWEGNNPIPPELWVLPDWVPLHPHRWWIHCRMVYLPMSYLYGIRFKAEEDPLILSLRQELYTQPYESIDWPSQRNNIASVDVYYPHTRLLDTLNAIIGVYEQCSLPPLRQAALDKAYQLIVEEDENTNHQCLGPVNKMMNQICRYVVDGPTAPSVLLHGQRMRDFMWMGWDGMRITGTNGSQLWDIGFICQALAETGLADEPQNRDSMMKALGWLDRAQIGENPRFYESSYRQGSKGAWPFSTTTQGYTVSDCTGEGLKASLYMQDHVPKEKRPISDQRLYDAVDLLLGMQNSNGSYASYELIRGPKILEWINPAEVFGNIMVEYEYPECTTSVITSFAIFRQRYPNYRPEDIDRCTRGAVKYLYEAQRPNGCWYGSWGICFTYATMFALESLSLVGDDYGNSSAVRKACDFLVKMQKEDGGWGESYQSCEKHEYIQHEQSQVVQTAWATMALMYANYPRRAPIDRAVKLVMDRQLPDGSWAQEAIEGMFNHSCAISYPNFKFSFTIWMLGKVDKYLSSLDKGANGMNGHYHNGIQNGYH